MKYLYFKAGLANSVGHPGTSMQSRVVVAENLMEILQIFWKF